MGYTILSSYFIIWISQYAILVLTKTSSSSNPSFQFLKGIIGLYLSWILYIQSCIICPYCGEFVLWDYRCSHAESEFAFVGHFSALITEIQTRLSVHIVVCEDPCGVGVFFLFRLTFCKEKARMKKIMKKQTCLVNILMYR